MDDFNALTGLDGKVALVTGAASGIGRATALRLAAAGAAVAAADIDAAGAAATAAACVVAQGRAVAVCGDVREWAEGERMAEAAVRAFGGLEILVNCAGLFPSAPALELEEAHWDHLLDVNLKGAMSLSQACGRRMRDGGRGGAIVNIASIQGLRPRAGKAAYAASKAGVIALTQVLAQELAVHGVRVNALAPGPVLTEAALAAGASAAGSGAAAAYIARLPLGRFGSPEEIAVAVQFLASPAAAWITGATLAIDGGALLS
jgi:NAD(P)-dependent dehydrogenase (short-subunit alcohol dehydrogenase family)